LLRMIGDPETRYREDPVRIVRVVRFAAKLGFALETQTEKPLRAMAALLANVPISRLFDEMVKLLQTGHALSSIEQLKKYGLVAQAGGGVFPVLDAALAPRTPSPTRDAFVRAALQDTDLRVAEGRPVAPSFMLACLLWHDVKERWSALRAAGEAPTPALQQAVDAVFDARIGDISGRGKLGADMREVWMMQPRFERRTPSSAMSLVNQARFRAGYDFLRLRADGAEFEGAAGQDLADWWEDFHLGSDEDREAMLLQLRAEQQGARGKRAAGAGPAVAQQAQDEDDADDSASPAESLGDRNDGAESGTEGRSGPPRKRRRRRRKPAGGGEGSGEGGGSGGSGQGGGPGGAGPQA